MIFLSEDVHKDDVELITSFIDDNLDKRQCDNFITKVCDNNYKKMVSVIINNEVSDIINACETPSEININKLWVSPSVSWGWSSK